MEQDWNKLIERYLQNELSVDGKEAFEFELAINPDLQNELDLHKLIHESVFRSVDRQTIQNIASKYHFQTKLKKWLMFTSIFVGLAVGTTVLALMKDNDGELKQETDHSTNNELRSKVESTDTELSDELPVISAKSHQFKEKTPKLIAKTIPTPDEAPKTVQNIEHKTLSVSADLVEEDEEKQTNKRFVLPKGVKGLKELRVESTYDMPLYGSYLSLGSYQVYSTPEGITFQNMPTGSSVFIRKAPEKNKRKAKRKKYQVFHVEGQPSDGPGKIYREVTK